MILHCNFLSTPRLIDLRSLQLLRIWHLWNIFHKVFLLTLLVARAIFGPNNTLVHARLSCETSIWDLARIHHCFAFFDSYLADWLIEFRSGLQTTLYNASAWQVNGLRLLHHQSMRRALLRLRFILRILLCMWLTVAQSVRGKYSIVGVKVLTFKWNAPMHRKRLPHTSDLWQRLTTLYNLRCFFLHHIKVVEAKCPLGARRCVCSLAVDRVHIFLIIDRLVCPIDPTPVRFPRDHSRWATGDVVLVVIHGRNCDGLTTSLRNDWIVRVVSSGIIGLGWKRVTLVLLFWPYANALIEVIGLGR